METSHPRIQGKEPFNWHTVGNSGYSGKNFWISISRVWRKVESLAFSKLGDGTRIAFWTDGWIDNLPLCTQYPHPFRITLLPKGSIETPGLLDILLVHSL
ncbi:hypothetical protein E5676_scaffold392G00670 [Cucumis melo var. makuwa]|uniref:Uncharacterized protein n=1 Tax=Cucumis melo var. makuwa TaxID=1194695 RepID=A0A5D3DBT2_CUCMM|nr:hypothetical protein E6C27_scaffold238G001500 [Cucumis melo var. makuwa]TYK21101.1 hypothetical protein E5676_scaffold392G00670 [Cucumis melo var. makuwa]